MVAGYLGPLGCAFAKMMLDSAIPGVLAIIGFQNYYGAQLAWW
jgi:hypothetical protein